MACLGAALERHAYFWMYPFGYTSLQDFQLVLELTHLLGRNESAKNALIAAQQI
jgi:hypothetical protein